MMKNRQRSKNELIQSVKEKRKIEDNARTETFAAYMTMSLYILNKEFGIGETRASRFIDEFYKLNSDIAEEKISFDSIKEYIFKKLGMKIE